VRLEHVLSPDVIGAGQHLVVKLPAVGLEQDVLGGPAEVGEVAQTPLIDLGLRQPGLEEHGEDDVLVLVASGGRGREDRPELLGTAWRFVTRSLGLMRR
jgi:hypothetical protein